MRAMFLMSFQANAPNNIPELYLPGPNEFIPENLNIDKKDVQEVKYFFKSGKIS
jgi:secreted Zn-dependent insulinase-like peptidase